MTRKLQFLSTLLLAVLVTACAWLPERPQPLRVSLVSVQFGAMELLEQRYALQLRVQNPNDFALNIQGLDFEMEVNQLPFASGVASQHVAVPAFGEALLQVEVSSSVWSLARQLREMGEGRREEFSYRLHGRLSVGGRLTAIPFESSGTIPLSPAAPAR